MTYHEYDEGLHFESTQDDCQHRDVLFGDAVDAAEWARAAGLLHAGDSALCRLTSYDASAINEHLEESCGLRVAFYGPRETEWRVCLACAEDVTDTIAIVFGTDWPDDELTVAEAGE